MAPAMRPMAFTGILGSNATGSKEPSGAARTARCRLARRGSICRAHCVQIPMTMVGPPALCGFAPRGNCGEVRRCRREERREFLDVASRELADRAWVPPTALKGLRHVSESGRSNRARRPGIGAASACPPRQGSPQ
jgi:hypothetical protein